MHYSFRAVVMFMEDVAYRKLILDISSYSNSLSAARVVIITKENIFIKQ